MKIVCVGCSYTDGHVTGIHTHKDTYPYQLQQLIPNSKVFNLGIGGGSNFLAYRLMERAIYEIKPDIIIRQITTPYRHQYVNTNIEFENNLFDWITGMDKRYWVMHRKYYNPHLCIFTSTTNGIQSKLYNERTRQKLHTSYYKHTHHEVMEQYDRAFLLAGDVILDNVGIDNITFSWFNNNKHNNCTSIEETLGFPDTFILDKGMHMNGKGNKLVAKLVFDMIDEKYPGYNLGKWSE